MKKTLTININNTVFHIDEDAYTELEKYFATLQRHFAHQEGGEEIVSDIEARASEHFNQRMRFGMSIIRLHDVTEVIAIMGKPEELDAEEENAPTQDQETNPPTEEPTVSAMPQANLKKNFYRDPDNKLLGGVLSGLSSYTGIDVVALRFFTLFFTLPFAGATFWIYIILWILVPEADTPAKKLEMRGEPITFENIKKILEESKEPVRKAGNTLLKIFVIIAKVFFGLFIGFFAFIFIIILFALISSVFALSTVPFSMLPISLSYLPLIGSPGQMAIAIGALIFTLGIPIYSIIRGVAGWIFNLPKQRNWVSVLLLILWIIGIFGTLVLFGTNLSSFFWHIQNS